MKILHVTNNFYPCVGGIENFTMNECLHLIKKGHKSDVLCLNRCGSSGKMLPASGVYKGIRIFRLPSFGPAFYRMATGVLAKVRGYDIIHIHGTGFFADFLSITKFMHKKPLILNTHGGFFHTQKRKLLKALYFHCINRFTIKGMDIVVADSRNDFDIFSGITKRIRLVENAVELGPFRKVAEKKAKSRNRFVFVGRLSRNKRVDLLIRAIGSINRKRKDVELIVIGEDWEGLKKGLEKTAEENGVKDRVVFRGMVTEKELLACLGNAEFFASASGYEGFGISAIEAMAAGCIPLLNRIQTFTHFVRDRESGFILDFGNPEKAAKAIERIIEMPAAEKAGISENARKAAEKYCWERKIADVEEIYRGVSAKI
jgi:alpha-1,3-mannosyltransferase